MIQETYNVGDVVVSRCASSSEPQVDKHLKDSIPKDASKDYGCLNKQTTVHLMKAGLIRRLAGKKQDSYDKLKVVRYEIHCEKHPKRTLVGIQHSNTNPNQLFLDNHSFDDQPKQTLYTWSEMKETFETEYETFVECPNNNPKTSYLFNLTKISPKKTLEKWRQ
jgi:hypothetical protein